MSLRSIPETLRIDPGRATRAITDSIRGYLADAGLHRIVLGLSGGVDSAVVAALCVGAAGAQAVTPYLLPYRTSSPDSAADAKRVAAHLGLVPETVDLSAMADPFFALRDPDPVRRGNVLARLRMIVLFDAAKERGALVAGTGNKTETYMGYCTWYGDSACSFLPIADLYKSQVWQLAEHLNLPSNVILKAPTADLWPGQTDEGELGLAYTQMDLILHALLDLGHTPEQVIASGHPRDQVLKVCDTMRRTEYKRRLPPVARVGRSNGAV
jgi:NAD+ synthase